MANKISDKTTQTRPWHDPEGVQAALLRARLDALRIAEQTNTRLIVSEKSASPYWLKQIKRQY